MTFWRRKRHYYRIQLVYVKNGRPIFRNFITLVLYKKHLIEQHRKIKKALSDDIFKDLPRHVLCNGELKITYISYLGSWRA